MPVSDREMPAGGATIRRWTLRENRSCYEAEALRFSVWVLSPFYIGATGIEKKRERAAENSINENVTLFTELFFST